jgi:hypothetical protein
MRPLRDATRGDRQQLGLDPAGFALVERLVGLDRLRRDLYRIDADAAGQALDGRDRLPLLEVTASAPLLRGEVQIGAADGRERQLDDRAGPVSTKRGDWLG